MLVHARRVLLCLIACAAPARAATFTVTNANDAGTNSLRWAISQANSVAGADTIAFNIAGAGVHTIALASALPDVTTTVTIDGTTQPGYAGTPLIELNGAGAGAGVSGLTLTQANNVIKGLAINRFAAHGVYINGGTGNHTITLCHIGTNPAGTVARPNGHSGVWVNGAPNVDIGPGNVISGNTVDGIRVDQAAAANTVITGNRIGTNLAGTAALPNGFNGIVLTNGVTATRIGGTTPAELNLISGNTKNGIGIASGSTATLIERNYIGLDVNGNVAVPNGDNGVFVTGAPNNAIGGTVTGTFNVISGNARAGVRIEGAAATGNVVQRNVIGLNVMGTAAVPNATVGYDGGVHIANASSNVVGGAWGNGGNLIGGNPSGVLVEGTSAGNVVKGNRIGTNLAGDAALGNSDGVTMLASGNTIGGTATDEGNLISGNYKGVLLQAPTTLLGNRVGLDAAGTAALPNEYGIFGEPGGGQIGNGTPGGRNVISGNNQDGVYMYAPSTLSVRGNYFGTDPSGAAAVPNGRYALYLFAAGTLQVGGTAGVSPGDACTGDCNLIDADFSTALAIIGPGTSTVQGNYFGLTASGATPLRMSTGVWVLSEDGLQTTTIGGPTVAAGNVIAGHDGSGFAFHSGIDIGGNVSATILSNSIGRDAVGRVVGDLQTGISVYATNPVAIGATTGGGNMIAGAAVAVDVNGASTAPVTILRNQLRTTTMGIDLGGDGVTANDAGDGDAGPNGLQNFPVLNYAGNTGSDLALQGTLASLASHAYRIEFFASLACNATGGGPGEMYLGTQNVTTDGAGNAAIGLTLAGGGAAAPVGSVITATATDAAGNTSEFSACRSVVDARPGSVQFQAATSSANENAGSVSLTVTRTNGAAAGVSVNYAVTGGTATGGGADYTLASGSVSFSQGETSKTILVALVDDARDEADETVVVTLSAPGGGATLGAPAVHTLAIVDNDAAPSVHIADQSCTEGASGSTPCAFTVSLSAASGLAVSGTYATASGGATPATAADYTAVPATSWSIPAGQTSTTVSVNVVGDALDEANETFLVNLAGLTNAAAGGNDVQATGTIVDDDAAPTVSIADRSCTEGASGSTACVFTVSLSNASGRVVSGTYATASGGAAPATAGTDYTAVAATAWSIAAGQTSTTLSVAVLGDTVDEANETFLVNLAGLANAAAGGNDVQALGTITDDDAANGQLRMSECSVEVTEGAATVQLTVERVGGSTGAVGVSWTTANGTATAGSDYTAGSGTLAWTGGALGTRSVGVTLLNGAAAENREYFDVTLSAPTGGATLGTPATTRVWILDAQDQILVDGFESVLPCN